MLLVGVPHWCEYLAGALQPVDNETQYVAVSLAELARHPRRGSRVLRVGFRPGALTARGLAFDVLWAITVPQRNRHTYWIGSDVSNTTEDGQVGWIRRWWRHRLSGRNAAGAPWFTTELGAIGLKADYLRFPYGEDVVGEWVSWPDRFAVSIYVPQNKPDFYGAQIVPELARSLPTTTFLVYGGGDVADEPNIVQMGFVNEFRSELARSVVHLRLTEHDAVAGTVRDALSLGRYVLFGYEIEGVDVVGVRDVDAIVDLLRGYESRFVNGELPPNDAGLREAARMQQSADAGRLAEWLKWASPSSVA